MFCEIIGIGRKLAINLYNKGFRSFSDLQEGINNLKINLPNNVKIGLKYILGPIFIKEHISRKEMIMF